MNEAAPSQSVSPALAQVRTIYESYLEAALAAEQNRRFGDGLLGFGRKPADDPCHGAFFRSLEDALQALAGSQPASGAVREMLEYIYPFHLAHPEPLSIYWMLLAAHKTTLPLIPLLSAPDAAALRDLYGRTLPRNHRLPVHRQIYKALRRQAG